MRKEVKEEYALIMAQRYGDTYFYPWQYNNGRQWYGYIHYNNAFPTIEDAKAKLQELRKVGIYTQTNNIVVLDSINEKENLSKLYRSVWDDSRQKGIFIIRVPKSYYLGNLWVKNLETRNYDFYTNEKAYYLYGTKESMGKQDYYLVYFGNGKFDWTDDLSKATFFSEEESEKVQNEVNAIRSKEIPYKGYVRVEHLPFHLPTEPKFQKFDDVYIIDSDYERKRVYKTQVYDTFVGTLYHRNKELAYCYEVFSNPYADSLTEKELYTKEELIALGAKFEKGYREDYVIFPTKKENGGIQGTYILR